MKIDDLICSNGQNNTPWRLFSPEEVSKDYCVLWIQGWSSSMDSHREGVERMAKATDITFATLDYAGHGLSSVSMDDSTRKQQYEETIAVYDELKKLGYKNIIVIGGSYGGYMTALLTGVRDVHTAVLRAAANYPDDEFELPYTQTLRSNNYEEYVKSKDHDAMLTNSMATRAIENYDGFVYVLEHELDEVVPAKVPRHYFKAAKHGNYLIIPNTKHSPKLMANPQAHFEYIEQVVMAIIKAAIMQDGLEAN